MIKCVPLPPSGPPPKPTGIPQSDDQFFVWNYAINHGWETTLSQGLVTIMGVTLPFEFEGRSYHTYKPFDAGLHRLVQHLRSL